MANENRHLIKISGVSIQLTSKKDTYFDMDADTTVRCWKTGTLKRNRIRKNVFKTQCTLENMDADYVDTVIGLLDPEEFTVELYDRYKKKRVTKTMYCGDRGTEDIETVRGTKSTLSFSLIEV